MMNIVEDCDGGLQALDALDHPLLHNRQHNILDYSVETKTDAYPDYHHQIMYLRILSWVPRI